MERKKPRESVAFFVVKGGEELLHEQHLPGTFDGLGQFALVLGGQACVFAGQNAALIGDELAEQDGIFGVDRVDSEIDFGFGAGSAAFVGDSFAAAFGAWTIGIIFARHGVRYG